MGRDKSTLRYHGVSQTVYCGELLRACCSQVFVSRSDAPRHPGEQENGLAVILDRAPYAGIGPMGGLLTAMSRHPENAWLVVACDLPFLNGDAVQRLVAARDPERDATAYVSPVHGDAEPLCTIYEPVFRVRLTDHARRGMYRPRAVLREANVALAAPPAAEVLENVNSPEEYAQAVERLGRRPQR